MTRPLADTPLARVQASVEGSDKRNVTVRREDVRWVCTAAERGGEAEMLLEAERATTASLRQEHTAPEHAPALLRTSAGDMPVPPEVYEVVVQLERELMEARRSAQERRNSIDHLNAQLRAQRDVPWSTRVGPAAERELAEARDQRARAFDLMYRWRNHAVAWAALCCAGVPLAALGGWLLGGCHPG